ncbi:MAG: hypothetical protein JW787_04320 [Sedimentisphaerales bacterium]|nr:hypothetical protein [Sedimentisphaerales bacterium]
MTNKYPIVEKLESLGKAIGSDEKLIDNVMSRIGTKPKIKVSQNKSLKIWRNMIKLASAAVIIIAVIVGLSIFQFNNRAYGITDVLKIIRQADTIHIRSWSANIKVPIIGEKRSNQERQYTKEDWIDLKNGRYCQEALAVVAFLETDDVNDRTMKLMKITDVFDGQYIMQVNQSGKSVRFLKLSEFQRTLSVRKLLDKFLEEIYMSSDELDGFARSGTELIDGTDYEIWEKTQNISEDSEYKLKYWVSPSSGILRKHQYWEKNSESNGQWQLTNEKEIEINQALPEDIFKTEIPEGYRASNIKENAFVQKLIAFPIRLDDMTGEINTMMVLPDGTVIMGWNTNYVFQIELLEELNSGVELPAEIPIELIYSLRPHKNPENISYSVRHLAVTQKNNVFYEWYFYVPNKDMSNMNLSRECQITMGLHTNPRGETYVAGPFTFMTDIELIIQDKNEFNTFVLGALAELSDGGKVPEDITYEKVLSLAQQIRESIP